MILFIPVVFIPGRFIKPRTSKLRNFVFNQDAWCFSIRMHDVIDMKIKWLKHVENQLETGCFFEACFTHPLWPPAWVSSTWLSYQVESTNNGTFGVYSTWPLGMKSVELQALALFEIMLCRVCHTPFMTFHINFLTFLIVFDSSCSQSLTSTSSGCSSFHQAARLVWRWIWETPSWLCLRQWCFWKRINLLPLLGRRVEGRGQQNPEMSMSPNMRYSHFHGRQVM